MKNLIILGAVLCLFNFKTSYAQVVEAPDMTGSQEYAVNTGEINAETENPGFQDSGDDPARSKNFSKTFAASRTDKINLNNQYGAIVIKVWDRKEVKIDIAVRAYSSNEKEAQRLIDDIAISAVKSGDLISCKTAIGRGGKWNGRNRKRVVSVNYVVFLPAANALTLSQQFGNVEMGDFSGPLSAKVQYGDFNAGNLSGTNNYITVEYGKTNIGEVSSATIRQQYGSGMTIGTAGTLDIDAQYAAVKVTNIKGNAIIKQQYGPGLTIGSVNNLDLDVQYANVNVNNIKGNATIKQQYNSLKIGAVGKLNLRSEYAGVTIGTLRGDGNFNMSYNDLNINEIGTGCRNFTADAEYVDIDLNFNDNYNADFTVQKSYGAFKYGTNVVARVIGGKEDASAKTYTGKIGNGGAAVIRIKADYGSVVFK